jgi:hypothetical protein
VSIFDGGTDLGGKPPVPATETRGGENPDWARARPGEPLPEKEEDTPDEP